MDNAKTSMLSARKKDYVTQQHPYTISQLSKGSKKGKWKTYIGSPRKEVLRRTEDEMLQYLYDYYRANDKASTSFQAVFDERLLYLKEQLNRSQKTIKTYQCDYKRWIPTSFGGTPISDITDSMVLSLFASQCRKVHPRPEALKKFRQLLYATFRYAQAKQYCSINPVSCVDISYYYKECDLSFKTATEKEFSDTEIAALMQDAYRHAKNPRALMMILANETGMRAGELAAFRIEDVTPEFLHIHRQQLFDPSKAVGSQYFDVPYTKDERKHPHNGRFFPINKDIQRIIDLATLIPGESVYLFHDPQSSEAIKKDSYEQYLNRHCTALGIQITNNHSFRMHRNGELIAMGLSPAERAVLLGHAVETNERYYSLADQRLLSNIQKKLATTTTKSYKHE